MEQNTYKIKNKNNSMNQTLELTEIISKTKNKLAENKAENIGIYKLEKDSSYTKIIIIAQSNSSIHLNALRENVFLFLKHQNIHPLIKPGKQTSADWLILDYIDFVIHLCLPEIRERYQLDQLFSAKV